jgi:hypothetical protein
VKEQQTDSISDDGAELSTLDGTEGALDGCELGWKECGWFKLDGTRLG